MNRQTMAAVYAALIKRDRFETARVPEVYAEQVAELLAEAPAGEEPDDE